MALIEIIRYKFLETPWVTQETKMQSSSGDNFPTLKMISEENAAGQEMKRAVGSIREGREGEKLVYKQKLPKYITNCNGESEVLGAWFAASKSGLLNRPEKATPDIYYAILLQGNCVFLSGARGRGVKGTSYLAALPIFLTPKGERGYSTQLENILITFLSSLLNNDFFAFYTCLLLWVFKKWAWIDWILLLMVIFFAIHCSF